MLQSHIIRVALVLLTIWCVSSSSVVPERGSEDYERESSNAVHLICNLKEQLGDEITSKNWKKVVEIMKQYLNEDTQLYEQLKNIENITNKDLPITATAKGYNDVIRVLLCHGLPINEKYYKNYGTMLHEAAWRGQYNTVKLLITSGADVNFEDRYGSIPLHYAADSGNVDIINFLIQRGSKINHPNMYWNYPIHWAVFNGRIQGVDSLLKNGADINVRNSGGETSLHVAVKEGQLGVLKLLLSKGCNTSIKDYYGKTALDVAKKLRHNEIEKILESVVS